jgi:glycerol-3-phosphate dehydrogenase
MKRMLEALANERFDVLVLGGGITGAGIALDAALRGFRVALIDKSDFASGTSSVSSKLVHGGLRYLEHGGFRLVHEALTERRLLLQNAPHLVQPLRFLIPLYRDARLPRWQWRLGLTFYDLLAGRGNLQRSQLLGQAQLLREVAGLRPRTLHGGAAYLDAQMDDARLCVEIIRTAARAGASVANYVEAVGFEFGGSETLVQAADRFGEGRLTIRAKQVVNAAGPWVDSICRLAGDCGGPYLRTTKGAHLIVPNRGGLTAALLLLHPADGRVFFVIPWPRRPAPPGPLLPTPRLLLGTTDTFGDEPPDGLSVRPDEIAYLLDGYNHYLQPTLKPDNVLGSFSGLRPLLRADSATPSAASREFRLIESPSGLLSVAGGKYTTYRYMAEVATDAVAERLGKRRRCRTRSFRLDGAPEGPWNDFAWATKRELCGHYDLTEETAWHLVWRYGKRAKDVAEYVGQDHSLAARLCPDEPDLRAEWNFQRDHEMALTPNDHWLRRTRLGLYHPEVLVRSP